MDFELSEEHRLIKDTARRIAKDVVAPRAKELDETGEYPHDYFEAFKQAGLLGMAIPEEMGGTGNGILPLCLAIEEVAKYECGAGLMLVLSGLPNRPIVFGGTKEQQAKYLPDAANGVTGAAIGPMPPTIANRRAMAGAQCSAGRLDCWQRHGSRSAPGRRDKRSPRGR